MASTSGTYNFSLSNADILIEALDRCEIRPPAITGEHMISGRRSLNLELQSWGNDVPKLWAIELVTIPLVQGVPIYSLPSNVICMLDTYIRQFSLQTTWNVAPNFSTVINSTTVTITVSNYGMVDGQYINIVTPVAFGGIVLQGFYQVVNAINTNSFTITSSEAATSTVSGGGTVPQFTATAGQVAMNVHLPNHGLVVNDIFNIGAQTVVGGITLYGSYTVNGVTDVNNFGITLNATVIINQVAYENGGLAQIQSQANSVEPIDYILTPFGRTDYAQIPDKLVQARPTSYWFNRQINSQVNLWQVPDQNGPYQLQTYCMMQIQDAYPVMGQVPQIPYRFMDALCAKLAYRLAIKYAKAMIAILKPEADAAYALATTEDRERAQISILPDLSGYYRA